MPPRKRDGTTAAIIYERLRSDIVSGKRSPGSPMSQLTIAKENGTSRGPVREAMSRLQQDLLVIGSANQRFRVAPFDIADLEAVLILHLVNVAFAASSSVPLLTDREIKGLEFHLIELDNPVAPDPAVWEQAYREFISVLVSQAGDRVCALISSLIDNIQRYRSDFLTAVPWIYLGGGGFRNIVEAARARDGQAAHRHYVELFGRVSSLILAGAAPMYDTARLRLCMAALGASAI